MSWFPLFLDLLKACSNFHNSVSTVPDAQLPKIKKKIAHKMSTRSRLFGSVGLGEAEDVSQGGNRRLQVELRRLREVGLLSEVVKLEQGGAAFHLGLDDGGWGDLEVAAAKEVVSEALHHCRPQFEDLEMAQQVVKSQ